MAQIVCGLKLLAGTVQVEGPGNKLQRTLCEVRANDAARECTIGGVAFHLGTEIDILAATQKGFLFRISMYYILS